MVALLLFSVSAGSLPVQADVNSVSLIHPGPGTYGEDDDYFTTVWGNPRDMDDAYDLYALHSTCNPVEGAMWTNISYSNGIWRGTTSDVGRSRYLFILNPGWVSSLDVGEDGALAKIDTSRYTQLTFRMRVADGAGYNYQPIHWADGPIGITSPRGTRMFQIQSDGEWHIYTFELSSDGSWTSGPVSSLWFQLLGLNAGYLVEIDWIRLTPEQSYQIAWDGDSLSGTANVYLGPSSFSPEQYGDLLIYDASTPRDIDASAKALSIPASLPGGTYYARVEVGASGETSVGSWTFRETPIAEIVAPSYTSGEDFATSVVGNPWDMNDTDDVDESWTEGDPGQTGLSYSVSDGILHITSHDDDSGDCEGPWPHRPLALNLGEHKIDSAKYKYVTYRYKLDDAPDQGAGGMMRVRWLSASAWVAGRTDDISVYDNGWHVFSVDLSTATVEDADTKSPWTDLPWEVFQIIVHESHRVWTSHLDWVKLTAEDTAGDSYTVQWDLLNVGDVLTTTIYWATDRDSGAVVGTGYVVPRQRGTVSYTLPYTNNVFVPLALKNYDPVSIAEFQYEVGTNGLSSGDYYYIAIKLEDEYNVAWWYSEVPVKKL